MGCDYEEQWLVPRFMSFGHTAGTETASGRENFSIDILIMGEEGFESGPVFEGSITYGTECATSDESVKLQGPPYLTAL